VTGPGIGVVIQARMSSRRMPGKVLAPLAGEPALVRMLERVALVRNVDGRVVATSTDSADDPVAEVCARHGLACVRGPLDDVLSRFLLAAPPEWEGVVRLTGDCPLVEPALVERHVDLYLRERPKAEYVTNAVVRTMPDGLDVEVVSRRLLEEADRNAVSEYDREHVTPWVRRRARALTITQEVDLSALRWTLDTEHDYRMIAAVYDELHAANPAFGSSEVYRLLLRRPELINLSDADAPRGATRADWRARIETHLATLQEADS